ncbi:MAG: helix-turn-helix transcriptional regulator [Gallionellaceae bacterium]
MSSLVNSYLRTHRRKWALTQKELAFLLGQKSSAHVSRLEQGKRIPSSEVVLACEVLFGTTPRNFFPKLYVDIEKAVLARAATLCERLDKETSKSAMRKKEFLSSILNRAGNQLNETKGV